MFEIFSYILNNIHPAYLVIFFSETFQYHIGSAMNNIQGIDSIDSNVTDGTHFSLQPQLDATFTSQTTRTARKINTSEYQV